MVDRLQRLPPRTLGLLAVSAVALLLTASWVYVLKGPLAEYRRLRGVRALLEAEVASGAEKSSEVARLGREVEALEKRLAGGSDRVPVNQMVAHVIAQLDRISRRHAVQLGGVKPGTGKPVFMFEEVPFEVEITGSYFGLYDWLREVEGELGPLVVKQFEISPEPRSEKARMRLTMVSYRPGARGT